MINYTFSITDMLILACVISGIASYIMKVLRDKKLLSDNDGDSLIRLMNAMKPLVLAKVNETQPNSTQFVDYIFKGIEDSWNDESDKTMNSKVETITKAVSTVTESAENK